MINGPQGSDIEPKNPQQGPPKAQGNLLWDNEGQAVYICAYSNPKLCLDVNQGEKKDRARIILFDYNGQPNQIWIREENFLISKNSGKVMDIEGGEIEGKNLIQFTKTGGPNQQFQIIPTRNNPKVAYITSPSGLALTVKDNNIIKRAEIIASKFNAFPNQHWIINYN